MRGGHSRRERHEPKTSILLTKIGTIRHALSVLAVALNPCKLFTALSQAQVEEDAAYCG
jgi:hypothetical protein